MSQNPVNSLDRAIQALNGAKLPFSSLLWDHAVRTQTLLSFLFFAIPAAFAANEVSADGDSDWRQYSRQANGDVYFYDASRVEGTADVRTVWKRIRYKRSVMAAASYQSHLQIDCSERTVKILRRTFFSDKNWEERAMNTDMKEKPKRPIAAGSAAERLSETVCAP